MNASKLVQNRWRNKVSTLACTSLIMLGAGILANVSALAYVPPGGGGSGGSDAPTPPSAGPTNLSVTVTSTTATTVKWTDPNDSGITLYKLYRNDVLGRTLGKTQVTSESTGAVNGTYAIEKSYRESGLRAGQNYTYKVEACYTDSLCSPASNSVTVVMRILAAPTGVTATPTATTATIGWTAVTDATSYKIYNGTTLAGTVTDGTTTYEATGLTAATAYSFTVVACDDSSASNACSAESTAASVTTAAAATTNGTPTGNATVTGAVTSQTISTTLTPASNDQGKQGSVFVAAVLPSSLGGGAFFMNNTGAWTAFTGCATAPAYATGNLTTTSIPVVELADLSGLIGTQIYVGTGLGGALSPAGTACNSMLNNGTYSLFYTVQ